MQGLIVAYLVSAVGIATVAFAVLGRNRQPVFQLFSILSFLISAWLIGQMLVDINASSARAVLGASLALANFLGPAAVLFAYSYPSGRIMPRKYYPYLVPALFFVPFSFSSALLGTSAPGTDGFVFAPGPLYLWQTIVLVLYVVFALILLLRRYQQSNALVRNRILLLLVALAIALLGSVIAGFVLSESQAGQIIRPISFLAMLAIIAYAMVYKGLFDIRLAVTRSIGYTLAILAIGVAYGALIFIVSNTVLNYALPLRVQIVLMVAAGAAALFFPYVKRNFDKATNRLFYQDAYDTGELIDRLNGIFVSTVDIRRLIQKTEQVLSETLKVSYARIVVHRASGDLVNEDNMRTFRLIMNKKGVERALRKAPGGVLVTDQLADGDPVRHAVDAGRVGMMIRMPANDRSASDIANFIILGDKLSGSGFTVQDVRAMSTIAKGLQVGLRNALQFEEIQQFNETLKQRVDDATQELQEANERLKVLDRNKDDFISMASHQLRTPLTSVKGYLSMVLEGDAGKLTAVQRKMIEQAFTSSQRMTYLISDLLNLSRLKTGKFVISATDVSLAELVKQEIAQLERMADAGGVELDVDMPAETIALQLDETKVRQVIMNLVDNAIYYTPRGGKITVRLTQTAKAVELRVIDTGIGVPKDEQHKLFTRFYRAANAKRTRPDGTGIGLYMVKKAVVAMGGAVIFDSTEGKGSIFGFSFPIK